MPIGARSDHIFVGTYLRPYTSEELAQDGASCSKTDKVIFKIRSYFGNRWDYLSACR